jgi:hypothetical protein
VCLTLSSTGSTTDCTPFRHRLDLKSMLLGKIQQKQPSSAKRSFRFSVARHTRASQLGQRFRNVQFSPPHTYARFNRVSDNDEHHRFRQLLQSRACRPTQHQRALQSCCQPMYHQRLHVSMIIRSKAMFVIIPVTSVTESSFLAGNRSLVPS